MRVSREEAARNREEVVAVAGRQFREHGYDGIGIAGLMEAAGRTHGGFYKQFDDKEALIVEATAAALATNRERWDEILSHAAGDPLAMLRRWYLSGSHVDGLADGCAFAALAAEAPRHGDALRWQFEDGIEASVALISDRLPDGDTGRQTAIQTIAQMVGTLVLARAVQSPKLAAEILQSGHEAATN